MWHTVYTANLTDPTSDYVALPPTGQKAVQPQKETFVKDIYL